MCSVVKCAALTVMILYSVGERKGNGKCSLVMCACLVQGWRFGGKWKGFSVDVCWFGTGWGRGREMKGFSCDVCCSTSAGQGM
jgi:hypothetical protein